MKWFMVSLVASAGAFWLTSDAAVAGDDGRSATQQVVVNGNGPQRIVVRRTGDGDTEKGVAVQGTTYAYTTGEDGDPAANVVFVGGPADGRSHDVRVFAASPGDEKAGWLGVSVAEVPEALAAQLEIEGEGVVVQNVVEGSPADKAGLRIHDVILGIGGAAIENNVGQLVEAVKSRKPGDTLSLDILRDGREQTLQVTLGSRAEMQTGEWKFEMKPDAEWQDQVHTFGKMLRKDADGNWVMEDLGDLNELKNLPDNIKMFLPKSGSKSVQVFTDGSSKRIRTKVEKDGNVLIVEQEGEGDITVTRVDSSGAETKDTYADADALKAADEDAYEMYEDSTKSTVIFTDKDGVSTDVDGNFEWKFDMDPSDWGKHTGEWQVHIEKSLEAAREAHDKAMGELHELMQEWKGGKGFTVEPGKNLFFADPADPASPQRFAFRAIGKPAHTFELKADGSIEVRIRRGDSELLRTYLDENDLADRDPKLYDKYLKLRDAEEDE